jgi:MraZ protein
MFTGSTQMALDGKGRLASPARLRERLAARCGGHLVLTADPTSGCLLLYPYPEWEKVAARLNALPSLDPIAKELKRLVIGSAEEVELDSAGRILVSPMLRRFAKLDKSVALVGQGDKFEIWDDPTWQARLEQAHQLTQQLVDAARDGTLSEELKGFSL